MLSAILALVGCSLALGLMAVAYKVFSIICDVAADVLGLRHAGGGQ